MAALHPTPPPALPAYLLRRPLAGLVAASLGCLLLLGGCRHVPLGALLVKGGSAGRVAPGAYADDLRVQGLIATWGERVARAQDRIALLTGIPWDDVEGEAVLEPLEDEARAFETRIVLRQGRRQPLVRVNLERLASGAESADAVLARSLTLAALEVSALRGGGVLAPWARETAGFAAAGDLADALELRIKADVLAGREVGARVDPRDPEVADTTGMGALLLLLERGGPDLVRAFLRGLADGDPAEPLLQRLVRAHDSPWPAARGALEQRVAVVSLAPWRLLAAAERAWADTGRPGLLAVLPADPPAEALEELHVLAARAAFAEGDVVAARALLSSLPSDAAARLRDPLAAAALRLKAEAAPGGDLELAQRLAAELERDYPRSGAIDRLRQEARLPEPPERAMASLERRAAGAGLDTLEIDAVRRLLDLLARASRHGAAQRLLERLGERASAPELAELAAHVAREQREPSEASRSSAQAALAAWRAAPDDPARRAAVVDHGMAAALALVAWLDGGQVASRAAAVALLGACAGGEAVALLASAWTRTPGLLPGDLEALASSTRVTELEVWTRAHAEPLLATIDAGALFDGLRLDLAEDFVRGAPDVPTALRSEDYAVRRAAFDRAVEAGVAGAAPRLVARMLADPSPLLRRDAARLAGEAGFEALARAALDDPAVAVRRAAALALGRAAEPATVARLLEALADDESPWVRAAAAHAAEQAAPVRPDVVQALVKALLDPHPGVEQAARQALEEVPPRTVAPVALEALEREAAQPEPRGPALKALVGVLEPALGVPLGYYPGMPREELRRLVARVRERLSAPAPPRR